MNPVATEAKFMGTVTALSMHEMQNILAIIRESAGLMGDVLKINAQVDFKYRPKMEQTLEHITSQIDRGKKLLEATSRLAHSPDEDLLLSCDLNIYARTVALLSERQVRLKGARVNFTPAATPLPVAVGALMVLMAGYRAVQWAVNTHIKDGYVQINLQAGDTEHALIITPPVGLCPDVRLLDPASISLPGQNARTHWDGNKLFLFFPTQQAADHE
ncbi:MAG: hypothetical protein RBR42_10360 [Desulfomicrobium sp.]|jgi:hypothetical protein|nr:hypothetical protein [Desulfomicrobium sp.]NLV96669.1 hypothetical protein [Desulfovibrionales bacterium]